VHRARISSVPEPEHRPRVPNVARRSHRGPNPNIAGRTSAYRSHHGAADAVVEYDARMAVKASASLRPLSRISIRPAARPIATAHGECLSDPVVTADASGSQSAANARAAAGAATSCSGIQPLDRQRTPGRDRCRAHRRRGDELARRHALRPDRVAEFSVDRRDHRPFRNHGPRSFETVSRELGDRGPASFGATELPYLLQDQKAPQTRAIRRIYAMRSFRLPEAHRLAMAPMSGLP